MSSDAVHGLFSSRKKIYVVVGLAHEMTSRIGLAFEGEYVTGDGHLNSAGRSDERPAHGPRRYAPRATPARRKPRARPPRSLRAARHSFSRWLLKLPGLAYLSLNV